MTDRTDKRSDSVVRTVLQTVAEKVECGPIPNVMAALLNIGGALCSTSQSLADAHYQSAVQ